MSREEFDVCKNCLASTKLLIDGEEVLICRLYGIRVNDEDSCQNIIIKSDDEEV